MPPRKSATDGLRAPAVTSSRGHIADWIEFNALQRDTTVSTADVKSWLDIMEDARDLHEATGETEDGSSLQLDESGALLISEVFLELERRERATTHYPFEFTAGGKAIGPKKHFGPGEYTYAYGLLSTECAFGRILPSTFFDKQDRLENPRILQVVGTIAASGLLAGGAMSFGFPRPKVTKFTEALASLVSEHLKEGALHSRPRVGADRFVKDAGIDVVAWRHFPDELPGKLILMGQCATGKNDWDTKSVRAFLRTFYRDFFSEPLASVAIEAIFIPFALDVTSNLEGSASHTAALSGVYQHYSAGLGIIVDRCRLAYLCPLGLSQYAAGKQIPDVGGDFGVVTEWVDNCIAYLRNKSFMASLYK